MVKKILIKEKMVIINAGIKGTLFKEHILNRRKNIGF